MYTVQCFNRLHLGYFVSGSAFPWGITEL